MTLSPDPSTLKEAVREYWNAEPCGTRDIDTSDRRAFFRDLEQERYALEPYIRDFARFERARGKKLLEIGVGAGTDFVNWVRNGADATGIDLTEEGIKLVRERLELEGLNAQLRVADAENLPFGDETFDVVYSYGVLHHSPDTPKAIREVLRVLKRGGTALIMIYHVHSWVSWMVWGARCLARGRFWKSPRWAVFHYLESPGTKVYSVAETRALFAGYSAVKIRTQLGHSDLLQMRSGAKYRSALARLAWKLYPRWLVRLTGNRFGLVMLIEATK